MKTIQRLKILNDDLTAFITAYSILFIIYLNILHISKSNISFYYFSQPNCLKYFEN